MLILAGVIGWLVAVAVVLRFLHVATGGDDE